MATATIARTSKTYQGATMGMSASIPLADLTVSSSTFTYPPYTKATMTSWVYNNTLYPQTEAQSSAGYYVYFYINGIGASALQFYYGSLNIGSSSGWKGANWQNGQSSIYTLNTADFFNSSNPTTKTLPITVKNYGWDINTAYGSFSWTGSTAGTGSATLTLDAPPILTSATLSTNTNGYYWTNKSTAYIDLSSSWVQYGGTIASATLTIGNQTATGTSGRLSIIPDTAGTFAPTLSVTDSRGQTTTQTLASITVQDYVNPTVTWGTVQSNTNGYYANESTATVTVSDITTMQGISVIEAIFEIGNQTHSITPLGGETSFTFSIPLNATGTFTPKVKLRTDAWLITTHNYSDITVNAYANPSVNYTAIRSTASGVADDEGTNLLLTATFTYTNALGNLVAPTVTITDENNTTATAIITWYESWNSSSGVSSAVNWANYNPASPVTLYGLITGYGSTTGIDPNYAFQVSVTPEDTRNTGTAITQTVASGFYTIDFLGGQQGVGGHGIAFGQPATQVGFFCNMDAHFVDNNSVMRALFDFIHPIGSYYETSDTSFDPNVTWGGTWVLENAGLMHISAGTGYAVSGATGDSGKGVKDGGDKDAIIPYHNHDVSAVSITSSGGHTHTVSVKYKANYGNGGSNRDLVNGLSGNPTSTGIASIASNTGTHTHSVPQHTTDYVGTSGNVTDANLPPYIAVNRWHRTA